MSDLSDLIQLHLKQNPQLLGAGNDAIADSILAAYPNLFDQSAAKAVATAKAATPAAPAGPDRSAYDARVTGIRVSNPKLSLAEVQRLARSHAIEEGFYAPGIGDSGLESEDINGPVKPTPYELLAADLAADPRAIEAERVMALSDEERAAEREAQPFLNRLTDQYLSDVQRDGEGARSIPSRIAKSGTDEALQRATLRLYKAQEAAAASKAAEPSIGDLRVQADTAFLGEE